MVIGYGPRWLEADWSFISQQYHRNLFPTSRGPRTPADSGIVCHNFDIDANKRANSLFCGKRMNRFLSTPCSGPARPGGTCISCGNILVSKNSGYLQSKYFKYALRQCPKSFNTTVQMWTAAPPPPPSCRPESQHQAKIIK